MHPTDDYLLDTTYPDRFHPELAPSWLNYVGVHGGAPLRDPEDAFTYLDLGCGFGHSLIVNAGAYPNAEFHACDFNPEHIAAARKHRDALSVENVHLHQARFEDLLNQDLPQFDYVVLQGVYTWVSAEVRATIVRILTQRLKPGGFVYVSYNCHPGWAAETPVRKLMKELATGESGTSEERAQAALGQLQNLADPALRYFRDAPSAVTTIEGLSNVPSNYLAHEYLNANWTVFYSVDVADELAEAGLTYVGSATLPDNHPPLILDQNAAQKVSEVKSERLRQLTRDFATNQRFRRDVFVRASKSTFSPERNLKSLDRLMIGCLGDLTGLTPQAVVPRGRLNFQPEFIDDLRTLLENGPVSVGHLISELGARSRRKMELRQNIFFLVAAGVLSPAAKGAVPQFASDSRSTTPAGLGALQRIAGAETPGYIPSEAFGTGVPVTPAEAQAALGWLASEPRATLPERFQHLGLVKSGVA